jgi:hypothetical protein
MEILVCGTFAVESGLDSLFSPGLVGPNSNLSRKHGFMRMSRAQLEYLVQDWLPFRAGVRHQITEATGIDVHTHSIDDIARFAESNISLMVALTYIAYSSSFDEVPDGDLASMGRCYIDHFDKHSGLVRVSDFVESYKEVFVD